MESSVSELITDVVQKHILADSKISYLAIFLFGGHFGSGNTFFLISVCYTCIAKQLNSIKLNLIWQILFKEYFLMLLS